MKTESKGWIKLHRKIMDNPYYFSEKFCRQMAWVDLLLLANHNPGFFFKRGIKVQVMKGQVGYDIDSLAKRWKWSRGKVLRWLNELETVGQIVRQKNNVTTIITISNYSLYQQGGKADEPADSIPNKPANESADGHKQECEECIEDKEENISDIFNQFRTEYPGTKRGLKTELENFLKKNKPESVHLLLPALKAEKQHHEKLQKFGRLVPSWKNLVTWINQRCWEQEFPDIKLEDNSKASSTSNNIPNWYGK